MFPAPFSLPIQLFRILQNPHYPYLRKFHDMDTIETKATLDNIQTIGDRFIELDVGTDLLVRLFGELHDVRTAIAASHSQVSPSSYIMIRC
jgi:hypothetical protein